MDAHESSDRASEKSNDGTNRHGRSKSSWGLSSAVHAVHGVGFVAKKVINNRLTDSLWHSRKSSSSASGPSDASDAKLENHSHETVGRHTSQPSLNAEDEQATHESENIGPKEGNVNTTDSNVIDPLEDSKPQDGSHDCTTSTDVVDVLDRSENTKPTNGSQVKPFNQHRWPSRSTTVSNVADRLRNLKPSASSHVRQVNQLENVEPSDGSHARPVNQHRWPGTVGSNVLNKTVNHIYEARRVPKLNRKSFPSNGSKPVPESSTDATNQPSSSVVDDGRLKIDKIIESQSSSPNKGVKPSSSVRGVSPTPTRGSPNKGVKPSSSVRGVSPTPTRGASPTPTRGASPTPTRGVSPTPTRGASPTPTRGVCSAPSRGVSPTPTRGVSPTPTRGVGDHAGDVGPTSVKPYKSSGRRHFFSANILSVFTKIVDNRKETHLASLKDVAQHLELLYNIQVQWQFANASAEAALDMQRETAEKSLFDVWRATLELRDSIASKKIDVTLLILQLKLYAVLYRQMAYMDEWASIQKEHESALFATTNDLQARSLSLPITGGVKADIKGLKLIVFSTIQVLQATMSRIQSMISKLDKTHFLASELANLVLHERALLDECEIFLASAAPLHIEECSLRSYLMQFNRTSMTE